MKRLHIVILIICLGCTSKKKEYWGLKFQDLKIEDSKKLEVNFEGIKKIYIPSEESKEEYIKASALIDTGYAVVLETTKDNLIGSIDEIKIYKDKIYILDIRIAKAVFVFDMKGKYLGRIGSIGKGPGEYPRPEGFEIDKKNDELLISNASIRKILRFDLQGKFLGNIYPEIGNYDFKITKQGNIVLLAGDYENAHLGELSDRIIYIINKQGDIIGYGPSNKSGLNNIKIVPNANLMSNNYEISYSYKLSDTIYSINENGINALYYLDFGKLGIHKPDLMNLNTQEFDKVISNGEKPSAYFLGTHFQSTDYLYFQYIYKNMTISCFYNKNQSKTIVGGVLNDHPNYFLACPFHASYKDFFIGYIHAYKLVEAEEKLQKSDKKDDIAFYEKMKEILGGKSDFNIKKGDNPVLFFHKLKKDYIEN